MDLAFAGSAGEWAMYSTERQKSTGQISSTRASLSFFSFFFSSFFPVAVGGSDRTSASRIFISRISRVFVYARQDKDVTVLSIH